MNVYIGLSTGKRTGNIVMFCCEKFYCADYEVCAKEQLLRDFDFIAMYLCRMINIVSFQCAWWCIGYCSNVFFFPGHTTLIYLIRYNQLNNNLIIDNFIEKICPI